MKLSKQARRDAKQLFRSCLVNGAVDDARARAAVSKVLQGKPRGYIAIMSHFLRLVKLDVERRTARIESAVPLQETLQAAIGSSLGKLYGPSLNISYAQAPALLGGLRIKVGSDVYDTSIRAKLDALKASF